MAIAARTREIYQPAVGYLRRSTDRQEQSIGDQRKAIERYAEECGFDLLDFYVDDAISGTSSEERKAFLRLISDARAPECPWRYVLVYDIKRFGRLDNDEAGYYRFELRRHGIEVVYVSEGFNGDDTDDLLRPVKQWQARQESRELSKVTIRGLVSRSSGGWWSGGQPPYGYDLGYFSSDGRFLMVVRYDYDLSKRILDERGNLTRVVPRGERLTLAKSDRCKLVPSDPARVETLRSIFAWYVHHGMGPKLIADRLNQQGVPSPRSGHWSAVHGDKWSMGTIREILRNPAYVGDMVWNRLTFGKFHRVEQGRAVPRRYRPGEGPQQNRPDDWVVVRNAHPALIPRALFETCQAKREARKTANGGHTYRTGSNHTSPYLLAGLIRCTHCGHRWQGHTAIKGRRRKDGSNVRTPYYICGGHVTKGKSCCQRSVIPQALIEGWVLEQIGHIVQDHLGRDGEALLQEMIRQELAGLGGSDQRDVASIRQSKADIEAKIENLLDNLTPTNREYVDRRIEKLREEMVELDRAEALALELQVQDLRMEALAEAAISVVRDFDRLVKQGTVEEKRTLIRAFLRVLDFDPITRRGVAHFWVVPSVGQEEFVAGSASRGPRYVPASMGSESANLPDGASGPGFTPQTTDSNGEAPYGPQEQMSSGLNVSEDTRYNEERTRPVEGMSSLRVVAGAGFEPATSGL
ncbi:MAG: recombinase family protein [Armatimonadota bacterium]